MFSALTVAVPSDDTMIMNIACTKSGFGGLAVACWPLVPKFAGSRVNKNPQHVGGHGCLSVVIVVCCQVEFSATN